MPNKGDKFLARSIVPGVENQIVIFEGIQEVGFEGYPDFSLYTLTQRIEGHSQGSTVSRDTLEEHGFVLSQDAP